MQEVPSLVTIYNEREPTLIGKKPQVSQGRNRDPRWELRLSLPPLIFKKSYIQEKKDPCAPQWLKPRVERKEEEHCPLRILVQHLSRKQVTQAGSDLKGRPEIVLFCFIY